MSDKDLVPYFMPALGVLLVAAEDAKGSPLDEEEVIEIRDNATVMMMKPAEVAELTAQHGPDLDPENCWYDWQMLRRELGRQPDLDPGARFSYVDRNNDEYQRTIAEARESLPRFRELVKEKCGDEVYALVKVLLAEPHYQSYMWLVVRLVEEDFFVAEIFELPGDYEHYKIGQRLKVADGDLQDWMINEHGTLFGGFSLRYNRARMDDAAKAAFDRQVGVTEYA